VISRSTVNAFKNYDKPLPEIARDIDVEYLVEASVLSAGDSITLQLRLIQAYPEENVVWAESCSSTFTNILKLHNSIAGQMAEKMNIDLSPEEKEKLPSPRQVNPESYKAYLRGMYHLNQLTPEGMEKGLEYLHEAIRIDPAEPFAHAGLALGYLEIAHGPLDPGDALPKAEAAATQAFKLDSTLAEVHTALGEVYLYRLWEFDKAKKHLQRAIEINPNIAMAHYHYSWALYLWGQIEEAIKEHILAQKYDPFNPLHTAWLGALYCYDDQFEMAINTALESFEIQRDYPAGYYVLGATYLNMGNPDKALEAHKKLAELYPWWTWPLGFSYAVTGHTDEAEKILEELEQGKMNGWKAYGLALIYSGLGNKDKALEYLFFEPHHAFTAWAAVLPEFEILHGDPRFQDFLERLNLPD
jgi:tetratricopeptide (TPR) repeat protein